MGSEGTRLNCAVFHEGGLRKQFICMYVHMHMISVNPVRMVWRVQAFGCTNKDPTEGLDAAEALGEAVRYHTAMETPPDGVVRTNAKILQSMLRFFARTSPEQRRCCSYPRGVPTLPTSLQSCPRQAR